MVRHANFLVSDSGMDVLRLAEKFLFGSLTLFKIHRVMSSMQAETVSEETEIKRLEERVQGTEADAEVLHVAPVRVDELRTECVLLAAGAELEEA